MPTTGSIVKGKRYNPPWWKKTLTNEDKETIREAVAVYCFENDFSANDIGATKDDILMILPTVARYIKKWNVIDPENFTLSFPAHRSLFDTMRNLIISKKTLQAMIDEIKDQQSHDADENEDDHEQDEDD